MKLPHWDFEALSWQEGSAFVFGGDEVGRGCLAGPVCVAFAELDPERREELSRVPIRDSKLVNESEREDLFTKIQRLCRRWGVGFASPAEIDRWNILGATELAFVRAWKDAWKQEGRVLEGRGVVFTDGHLPLLGRGLGKKGFGSEAGWAARRKFTERPIVKGDRQVVSIAAASLLAKVSRDRLMRELHIQYPQYGFDRHKGYLTADHLEKIREHGPCSVHRMSFAPLKQGSLFSSPNP